MALEHLIDDALALNTHAAAPLNDEALIERLGQLSDPEAPDRQRDALDALRQAHPETWTPDRVEGAVAAMTPVAMAAPESDDDFVLGLWTLLSTLLSHHSRATGVPGERTFLDTLITLLNAEAGDIRGFAATSLGKAAQSAGASALATAMTREVRWDVALRMTGALIMTGASLPTAALNALLNAPTEEAVAFAAQQIGQRALLDARPAVIARIRHTGDAHRTTRDALTRALRSLDVAHLQDSLDQFTDHVKVLPASDDAPKTTTVELLDYDARHAFLNVALRLSPGRDEATLRLALRLPDETDEIAPYHARFDALLRSALGPVTLVPVSEAEAGTGITAERTMRFHARLDQDPPLTALHVVWPLVTATHHALQALERPTTRRPALLAQALDNLLADLETLAARQDRLKASFKAVRALRLDDGRQTTTLAAIIGAPRRPSLQEAPMRADAPPALRGVLIQDRSTLSQPHPGVALHLDIDARTERDADTLARRLADLLKWKCDLALTATLPEGAQADLLGPAGLAPEASSDGASLMTLALTTAPETPSEDFEVLLTRWLRLLGFLEALGAILASGAPLEAALGLTPPEPTWAHIGDDPADAFPDPQQLRARKLQETRDRLADQSANADTDKGAETSSPPRAPETDTPSPQRAAASPETPRPPSTLPSAPPAPPRPVSTPSLPAATAPGLPSTPSLPSASAKSTPSLPSASAKSTPSLPSASAKSTPSLPSKSAPGPRSSIEWPPRGAMAQLGKPAAQEKAMPSLPSNSAQSADPSSGRAPLNELGQTPSEVVKSLQADIARVDVYLRTAGYNHGKLAQIMSIMLNMSMGDARVIIERAPCILTEDIPRDRARTIKTVLEGTGAKIAVTPTGEGLE